MIRFGAVMQLKPAESTAFHDQGPDLNALAYAMPDWLTSDFLA